jgi:hypothetical protein
MAKKLKTAGKPGLIRTGHRGGSVLEVTTTRNCSVKYSCVDNTEGDLTETTLRPSINLFASGMTIISHQQSLYNIEIGMIVSSCGS